MKKLITSLVVLTLLLTMFACAFALDTEQEGTGTSGTAITTLAVQKEIVLFNTTSQDIYEPNITFTYTLEVQNPGSTTNVTDKNSVTGTVKTGVAGLVTIQGANGSGTYGTAGTSASLVFGDDTSAASDTNAEGSTVTTSSEKATRNLTVAFNPSALRTGEPAAYPDSAAGIYRFKITDTTAASALTAAGIARNASYDPVRYLDVYVEWANDAHTDMRVYGWVLYKTSNGSDTANGTTSLVYDGTDGVDGIKVTGYNVESEMLNGTSTADEYHTYNLTVTKATTGSMADLNHEFPVSVSFANSTVTSQTNFYSTGDFANASLALSAAGSYSVNSDYTSTPTVKNGDTFTFVGLPAGTQFQLSEKNDTADSYKVTILDETTDIYLKGSSTDGVIVASNANTGATTATALGNLNGSSYESENIRITNKLDSISPTGYISRFAPYALMLVVGLALVLIARKGKKANKEE